MKVKVIFAKGCEQCKWLEWVDGEEDCNTGYDCNKRHEQMHRDGREDELLENLDKESYRKKYKRCFEQIKVKT